MPCIDGVASQAEIGLLPIRVDARSPAVLSRYPECLREFLYSQLFRTGIFQEPSGTASSYRYDASLHTYSARLIHTALRVTGVKSPYRAWACVWPFRLAYVWRALELSAMQSCSR